MKITEPKAIFIAGTTMDYGRIDDALFEIGADGFNMDGESTSEDLIEFAGKLCYMSFDKSLNANLTRTSNRTNKEYIQKQIIAAKHGSVLEHATATFLFANVSRVVTHELVRHRAGTAFSQVSGRYVRAEPSFYVPRVLRKSPEAVDLFLRHAELGQIGAGNLEAIMGIDEKGFEEKKRLTSAIRRVIGNGQSTHLVMTANHRAWRHIIQMRTARGAEEEIRDVVGQVARYLRRIYPAIYADMVEAPADDFADLPVYFFDSEKV